MKTSELIGAQLDWAVAKCEGLLDAPAMEVRVGYGDISFAVDGDRIYFRPSEDWTQGGPIIEREGIDLYCNVRTNKNEIDPAWRGSWRAKYHSQRYGTGMSHGTDPLIAAMRCYVASKLGNEIEIPEELK